MPIQPKLWMRSPIGSCNWKMCRNNMPGHCPYHACAIQKPRFPRNSISVDPQITLPRGMLPSRLAFPRLLLIILLAIPFLIIHIRWRVSISGFSLRNQVGPKLAYATLLLATNDTSSNDAYFISIRILNYQLQYAPRTRNSRSIPFLVLATPDVEIWKLEVLAREGATIIQVQKLDLPWISPLYDRWRDVMVKLRLWQLVEYDRILFLDGDTFVLEPLEGVFRDAAATPRDTLALEQPEEDGVPLPQFYVFATLPEVRYKSHPWPPHVIATFNAGFFLISPSLEMYAYYISLMRSENKFDSSYPEQNLLNYAHRLHGNMPWQRLKYWWNVNLPNARDIDGGVKSVHEKLWSNGTEKELVNAGLRRRWAEAREEMERFFNR